MKSSTRLLLIGSSTALIFVWTVGICMVYVTNDRIVTVQTVTDNVRAAEQKNNDSRKIKETVAAINSQKIDLSNYVASEANIVDFIESIERLAREQNLKPAVSNVSVGGGDGDKTLDMTLTTTGDWSSTLHFMHLIETLPYASTIMSTHFSLQNAIWRYDVRLQIKAID